MLALLLPTGGDGAGGSKRVKDFVESAEGLAFVDPEDTFLDIVPTLLIECYVLRGEAGR